MILHRCFGMVAAMLLLSTAAQAADYRLTIAFDKTNPATPLIGAPARGWRKPMTIWCR